MKIFVINFILIITLVLTPMSVFARIPNDPNAFQWGYDVVNAYEAWDKTVGSNSVVVAVVDNGFDIDHPDLVNHVWKNEDEIPDNNIDDDNNGYVDDVYGWNFDEDNNKPEPDLEKANDALKESDVIHHATVVAGIIGATIDNGIAGAGISQAKLMNLKVVNSSGSGSFSGVQAAIRYAVDNGADVINVSLVSAGEGDFIANAVEYAYKNGVSVFAAVGNSSIDTELTPRYPACVDADLEEEWVLGVSAINRERSRASFSNIGLGCVDLTAPGVDLEGPKVYEESEPNLQTLFGNGWNGTSFAVPLVSGTAALIKSIHPNWSPKQVYDTILSSVQRTPPSDPVLYEQFFGAGLLQIDKAVDLALEQVPDISVSNSLIAVQEKTNSMAIRDIASRSDKLVQQSALAGIDDITVYEENGKLFFATVNNLDRKESLVNIYNEDWQLQESWTFPSTWIENIIVEDIMADSKKEIIVVPAYGDNNVFRVFSNKGNLLRQYTIDEKHNGASLALLKNNQTDKFEIIVTYKTSEGVQLRHFGQFFDTEQQFTLPQFAFRALVDVGDVDGDGDFEYIVSAQTGEKPYIAVYKKDKKLSEFLVADPIYRGGISTAIKDYNQDGSEDIIISQNRSGKAISVWSGLGEKLDEWYPFGRQGTERIQVLGVVD